MSADEKDATGRRLPMDIADALRFVEAEMAENPGHMGARNTGPAFLHYAVIRDVLRAALSEHVVIEVDLRRST